MAEKQIAYTERDFLGIRNELLRLTNTYYPDLIQNANDASIYSVFLDLNAAVADNLNFQIDRTFQETVLQFAEERSSLYNLARTYGLKVPGNRPSVTVGDLSVVVPALGDKEDFKYLGLLRAGAQFNGGGQIFELVDDCDFSSPYSVEGVPNRTKIPNFDANGNLVNYTMTKREVIVNGTTKIFKKEILDSNNKPFFKLFLPEKNIISVTSIIQKPGVGYQSLPNSSEFISPLANKWYEVDALAQNEVFVEDPSSPPDNVGIKVGTYVTAPQRFVTEYTPEGFFFLTFGGGNQTSQDLLDEFTSKGVKLDMSKFMNNIALGNTVKGNSTLFIQYRVGGGKSSNIGAGAVRNIGLVDFVVAGPSQQVNQSVINSLSINNVTSAIGGADPMTQDEIRNYISFNFAAQKRAVTINDYVSQLRTMPSSFGSPAKASATEIENKIKLSVLSYTPGGTLTSNVSSTLKNNIATYLSNHRMINDYIMVGSAKVIDLRLEIDLIIANGVNQSEVVTSVISIVGEYFKTDKIEMGQDLALGELRKQIMNQDGVVNIVDVRVYNQVGDPYSQSVSTQPYINATTKQIGLIDDTIFAQPDEILQIMSPQKDISVRTKRNTKPTFS
jgi:hypothetical protein|tara:strand:+ start:1008 stop:2849 length:1842 start_codon:yes stop_codon:yes gene_type:complete